MPYINVGQENSGAIDIYYEDFGSGKPVVLIHGFPLSGRAWEKQTSALLNAGFRVITYDRRGFGISSQPTIGYDYDTFAEDLNKLMNKLDLRDTVLVGHSMGAGEITRYLGKYGSDRVSKAVFVSPVPPFLLKTDDDPEGVDRSVFDGIQKAIENDRPAYQTQFLTNFFNLDETMGKRVTEEVVRANWNIAVEASPTGTYECVGTWMTDFRNDIPNINVPSLIIQGDADRITPYQFTGKRLHEMIEGSQLVTLAGAPHGIPWTHADEVNRTILGFITRGEKAAAA
jgi:non-heme chloroperoxidase